MTDLQSDFGLKIVIRKSVHRKSNGDNVIPSEWESRFNGKTPSVFNSQRDILDVDLRRL